MTTLTTPDPLDAGSDGGVPDESAATSEEPGPISPELVLVDPALAQLVRATPPAADTRLSEAGRDHRSPTEVDARADLVPPDQYERWGDELRLFLEPPAPDEALVGRRDDAVIGPDGSAVAIDRRGALSRRRRLGKRIARLVGILTAVTAVGAAAAVLSGLVSTSFPDAASPEADVRAPAGPPPPPQDPPTTVPTKPSRKGGGPRIMAWAPAPGAAAYEVALYNGSRRIFLERTKRTRLALPAEWSYRGRRLRLEPGVYRWYVWPVRAGARKASSRPVVQANLTIPSS